VTKLTLSQYLSDLTHAKVSAVKRPNAFPIDRNDTYPPETSTTTPQGTPAPLTDASNEARFAPSRTAQGLATESAALIGLRDEGFNKDAAPGTKIDGHSLLQQPELIERVYTSRVLAQNRFTADAPAPIDRPLRFASGVDVTHGRLATVALTLGLRSSRELGSSTPGADPNSAVSSAGALLPSPAQLGVTRVETALLTASDVISRLTEEEQPAAISLTSESWGTLNNALDQFSGVSAVGMYGLAVSLGASIVLLVEGISALLVAAGLPTRTASRDASGRYALGSHELEATTNHAAFPPVPFDFGSLIGVRSTVHPFMIALRAGTRAFFGVDVSSAPAAAMSAAHAALGSPGYYAVVARTILRSGMIIADQLRGVGGNPIEVAKQVAALVDVLRASKLIAALNVFAQLGDQVLSHDDAIVDSQSGHPSRVSTLDSFDDDSVPANAKSRLRGNLKLAWASNRAPTLLLLPAALDGAMLRGGNLGAFDGGGGGLEARSRTKQRILTRDEQRTGGALIPADEAFELERQLESEYVPFYFKDLRTREVIAFHAFLASLSDDYSVNWEQTDGFGRVDSVGVYKSTGRKISMSFHVASTSPADFDEMWLKINKLVTLVYPQFTAGKTLTTSASGDYRFVQPFSQLISAGPIVRIRLGDLLHSNFSRFALARLFGLGGDMRLDGTDIVTRPRPAGYEKKLRAAVRDPRYEFKVRPGTYSRSEVAGLSPSVVATSVIGSGPTHAPILDLTALSEQLVVRYKGEHPSGDGRIIVEVRIPASLAKTSPATEKFLRTNHDDERRPLQRFVGGAYVVPADALEPTTETRTRVLAELEASSPDEGQTKLADFMRVDSNAVVRSFRSAGGKGLAGRIDSLAFDWYDRASWETAPGRTAPLMCKVTLAFTPIHDIAPGLDHLGFNRAPVYPVGTYMKHGDDAFDGRGG
jgi:hypothetical protein